MKTIQACTIEDEVRHFAECPYCGEKTEIDDVFNKCDHCGEEFSID